MFESITTVKLIRPPFPVELPPKFLTPIENATIMEGEEIEFTCTVSKEGATVKWFIDNKELVEDERYIIDEDKGTHTLTIKDAILPDSGDVKAKVEDNTTNATLTVKGKKLIVTSVSLASIK